MAGKGQGYEGRQDRHVLGADRRGRGPGVMDLADLEGHWRLGRVIEDRRAGLTGRFEGEARWTRDGSRLVQDESGLLRYGVAAPMRATRRYVWHADDAGLNVLFEDGRPFHIVPAAGDMALHQCPPDAYRVLYVFDLPGRFTTTWHVTGPRKDATLTSIFTRV